MVCGRDAELGRVLDRLVLEGVLLVFWKRWRDPLEPLKSPVKMSLETQVLGIFGCRHALFYYGRALFKMSGCAIEIDKTWINAASSSSEIGCVGITDRRMALLKTISPEVVSMHG